MKKILKVILVILIVIIIVYIIYNKIIIGVHIQGGDCAINGQPSLFAQMLGIKCW